MSNYQKSTKSPRTAELDSIVFDRIKQNPGVTIKRLEIILKNDEGSEFSQSFLTNSLRRLENLDKAIYKRSQKEFEHGKIVRQYYAVDEQSSNYDIKLGTDVLQQSTGFVNGKELWAFAIGNKEIVIATNDNDYYQRHSIFSAPFLVTIEDGVAKLKFPKKIVDFYKLKPESYSINFSPHGENKAIILEINYDVKSTGDFRPLKTKKILIFDDDEDFCTEIVENLKREGHEVEYVTSDIELLERVEQSIKEEDPFDFICLDKKMFTKSKGEEDVAARLYFKILEMSPGTQVGLLSGKMEDSERSYFANLGFKTVLKKKEDKMGFLLAKIISAL